MPRVSAARINQIIGINDWYFFPKVAAVIVFHRIIGPVLLGLATDEAAVAAALPDRRVCIAELDRLLGARPFLAGEHLSIADLVLAPQLDFFAATPEGTAMLAGRGSTSGWVACAPVRACSRPSDRNRCVRPRDAGHTHIPCRTRKTYERIDCDLRGLLGALNVRDHDGRRAGPAIPRGCRWRTHGSW